MEMTYDISSKVIHFFTNIFLHHSFIPVSYVVYHKTNSYTYSHMLNYIAELLCTVSIHFPPILIILPD